MNTSGESNVNPGLVDAVIAVSRLASRVGCDAVSIGGVAVSLISEPRYTQDVDAVFMLDTDDLPRLVSAAAEEGIVPRVENPVAFAMETRVVPFRHTKSGVDVDISLGVLPFEVEMTERSTTVDLGRFTMRLPTPEDLIIMKAVAHRPKDMLDIRSIVSAHPNVDRTRIERWVREFADVLEEPEIWDDVAEIVG